MQSTCSPPSLSRSSYLGWRGGCGLDKVTHWRQRLRTTVTQNSVSSLSRFSHHELLILFTLIKSACWSNVCPDWTCLFRRLHDKINVLRFTRTKFELMRLNANVSSYDKMWHSIAAISFCFSCQSSGKQPSVMIHSITDLWSDLRSIWALARSAALWPGVRWEQTPRRAVASRGITFLFQSVCEKRH